MLRPKLKITDLKSHQEYLLLVTKMNLKGVLVESTHTLAKGSKLRLSLQLDDGSPSLNLKGVVHKVAQRPDGSRAMIISFIDPDPESQKRIRKTLGRQDEETEEAANIGLSSERTMMVDEDTLSKLTVEKKSSPVEDSMEDLMPSTMDEESVQAANPGLAGSTRIVSSNLGHSKPRRKSSGSFMKVFVWITLLGVVLLAFLIFSEPLLRWLQDKPIKETPQVSMQNQTIEDARPKSITPIPTPNPIVDTQRATPTPKPTATPNPIVKSTPKPTPKPTSIPKPVVKLGAIRSLKVSKEAAFLKFTLKGEGDFSKFETSKAMSPKRLVVDLLKIRNLKVSGTTAVAKNPVLRVRAAKTEKGVRLTFDLYPVTFPRFKVKSYNDSIEIFIFK